MTAMKKYFVFSDVHSFYDELMDALNQAGFEKDNEDHILISLGDLCDRGPKSREVLTFINSLPGQRKLCVIGNHEILMELMIRRGYPDYVDTYNGIVKTAIDISEEGENISDLKNNRYWNEYRKSWHWYYEICDFIFLHGWIPYDEENGRYKPDWRNSSIQDLYMATYINGMEAWNRDIREKGKTVFCGHWNTSWGHCHLRHDGAEFAAERNVYVNYGPFIDEGIVALDACTVQSHKVNVYVLEME